jgi:hypothetical protein
LFTLFVVPALYVLIAKRSAATAASDSAEDEAWRAAPAAAVNAR